MVGTPITHDAVLVFHVARALLDCRGIVMPDRLIDVAREAGARGLLRRSEAGRVIAALEATG